MKITLVHGFFLPIPPVAGGAMEKIWWRLAREFAARGHEVVSISRRWPGFPQSEFLEGVHLHRRPGHDHSRHLPLNLLLDALGSLRALRHLPAADILVSNNVALPALAPRLTPRAGRLVANLNRYPKGQLRTWGRVARIQAASASIAAAAARQAPALASRIRLTPNPVDLALFNTPARPRPPDTPLTLGFTGRLHPEKGLELLAAAARHLATLPDLPPWRIVLRGPADIPRGGGGPAFEAKLLALAGPLVAEGRWQHAPPEFDATRLAATYHNYDLFVYPTRAELGEALPVAVLEALAAGVPVVATDLACFNDYVVPGRSGRILPLSADARAWAETLATLIRAPGTRARLAAQTRATVAHLDYPAQAESMLADFATLA
ncbi:MAG: glycosyltransferase family 4 protein [Verrucomicrobia bacterium]|nr:glycosyltransferase family 4 protein [Verrucomicrobiota bacterium]